MGIHGIQGYAVADPAMEPPLGLELVLRNTGDGPNGTLLPGKMTKKTVALAHICMF